MEGVQRPERSGIGADYGGGIRWREGSGKTEIVVEYCYRHKVDYPFIFWASAEREVSVQERFVAIAMELNINPNNAQDPEGLRRIVMQWFQSNVGWLLVFDNADESEDGGIPAWSSKYFPANS